METLKISHKAKELQLLLDFINANSPLPLQSEAETMRLLDQHALATCTEISENLASLHGTDMSAYFDWADEELFEVNVYGYHILIMSYSDNELLRRLGNTPRADTEECQIGKVVTEGMSPEERKERFEFSLDITQRYLDKLHEVADHLGAQYRMARKVELLSQKEEEYISELLERKHQKFYTKINASLGEPFDELPEETDKSFPFFLEQLYKNQKAEINNNFYDLPSRITRPYLRQMLDLFSQHLLQVRITESNSPNPEPLRQRCMAQLEALCEQLRQLQERQAAYPYLVNLSDLMPKNEPFVRFLLMKESGVLSGFQENPAIAEADKTASLAGILNLSESMLLEYLKIAERPSSTWTSLEQHQLKLVKEYMERLSGREEYNYSPVEEA